MLSVEPNKNELPSFRWCLAPWQICPCHPCKPGFTNFPSTKSFLGQHTALSAFKNSTRLENLQLSTPRVSDRLFFLLIIWEHFDAAWVLLNQKVGLQSLIKPSYMVQHCKREQMKLIAVLVLLLVIWRSLVFDRGLGFDTGSNAGIEVFGLVTMATMDARQARLIYRLISRLASAFQDFI